MVASPAKDEIKSGGRKSKIEMARQWRNNQYVEMK